MKMPSIVRAAVDEHRCALAGLPASVCVCVYQSWFQSDVPLFGRNEVQKRCGLLPARQYVLCDMTVHNVPHP